MQASAGHTLLLSPLASDCCRSLRHQEHRRLVKKARTCGREAAGELDIPSFLSLSYNAYDAIGGTAARCFPAAASARRPWHSAMWWDERSTLVGSAAAGPAQHARLQAAAASASPQAGAATSTAVVDLDCPYLRSIVLEAFARRPHWCALAPGALRRRRRHRWAQAHQLSLMRADAAARVSQARRGRERHGGGARRCPRVD